VAKGRDRPQAAVIGKKRGFRARTPGGWRGRHAPATLTLAVALGLGGPDVSETHFASEGGRVWFGATRKGRRRAQPRRRRAGGITGRRPRREGIEIGYGSSRRAFGTSNPRVERATSFFFQRAQTNPSETDAARCSSTLPTPFARSGSPFLHFEARHAVDARVRPARARPASSRDSRRRRCAPPPDPPFPREASASASASRARRFQLAPQMDARRPSPLTSSSPPLRSGLVLVLVPVPPAATCRVPWT
jgi:hypothetical protein